MRDQHELTSKQLHDLERSQGAARLGLGRASGLSGLVDNSPTVPPVDCRKCGRNVASDPWSYDEPPRRWCQTCGHIWSDADALATARAEGVTIHFSTPETMAAKARERGRLPMRPSLVQERRERSAREKQKAKARKRRKAQRKARRR